MDRDDYRDSYIRELEGRIEVLERELRRNFFVQSLATTSEGSEDWDTSSVQCSLAIQYHGKGFSRPVNLPVRDDGENLWKTPAVRFFDKSQPGLDSFGHGIIAQRSESGVVKLRHSGDKPLCIEQGGYWLNLYAKGE